MASVVDFKIKTVNELVTGDVVLHPVYRSDGLLFVKRYKRLTDSVIRHLKRHFPLDYPIVVTRSQDSLRAIAEEQEGMPKEFYRQLEQVFKTHQKYIQIPLKRELYGIGDKGEENVDFLNQIHPDIMAPMWEVFERTFDSKRLLERAKRLDGKLNHLISKDRTLLSLFLKIYNFHDELVVHSLNTTCIAIMIGLSLELSDDELTDLALATLFADIGYTEVAKTKFTQYLNTGKLDAELVTEHVRLSVEIISQSSYCRRKNIVYGILDHHEYYDGSGLPNQKAGSDIHLFGRIIAIAQFYDELMGGYFKGESLLSFEALEEIWKERGKKVDPAILRVFIDKSRIYKVGESIQLPGNELAIVIGFKDYIRYPLHPIVIKASGQLYDCSARLL